MPPGGRFENHRFHPRDPRRGEANPPSPKPKDVNPPSPKPKDAKPPSPKPKDPREAKPPVQYPPSLNQASANKGQRSPSSLLTADGVVATQDPFLAILQRAKSLQKRAAACKLSAEDLRNVAELRKARGLNWFSEKGAAHIFPEKGVAVYEDNHYYGGKIVTGTGEFKNLHNVKFDNNRHAGDRISSVRIDSHCKAEFFENGNFGGHKAGHTLPLSQRHIEPGFYIADKHSMHSYFRRPADNDEISSMRVHCTKPTRQLVKK